VVAEKKNRVEYYVKKYSSMELETEVCHFSYVQEKSGLLLLLKKQ
jgi:hypothetical protein